MSEVEKELRCENCGSTCRILYNIDMVHYDPENCPFCGEIIGSVDYDEEWDEFDDDGLDEEEDSDDDTRWN